MSTNTRDAKLMLRKLYLTPQELGDRVGVSRQTVVKWCVQGRIDAYRTPGGHWRISVDNIDGDTYDRMPVTQ